MHGLATVLSRADTTVNYVLPCDFIHESVLEQSLKQIDCMYWKIEEEVMISHVGWICYVHMK
jgi:hypothetical protein